jgi:hypothetical protein
MNKNNSKKELNYKMQKKIDFEIYRKLAGVPGVARENSILIYTCKTPIGLKNI